MSPFTTPQTESCIPTLVRISSSLLFRLQYSQHHSTNTTTPNDVRGTSSGFSEVIARNEDNTPLAIPRCDSPSQTLGERRHLPSAYVPAIRILCRIFSASNLSRNTPEIYAPRVLRELYLGAHARGMLGDLSGPQFSAMISLYGTLSVSDPPSRFKSPLAQHIDKKDPRAWWGFIFQMVRDKQRVTGVLKECDLHWLMRAKASKVPLAYLNVYAGDGGGFPSIYPVRSKLIVF
jgi:hypothetical protein